MAVAPESIAGEKERGTIATLLVTPMKRSELAIGKIISLGIIAMLSGLSSFLGSYLSLPILMSIDADQVNTNIYGAFDFILLGLVIISTVLLLISVISIISAFAKTVKEATTTIIPLMVVSVLIGVSSMFGDGSKEKLAYYFIPLYNSVQSMRGIFSFSYVSANIIVTIASNILYAAVFTVILTRMFNSERTIFSK